jgi:hypothetical protein
MITKYVVVWRSYGNWKCTVPFDTEKAASTHADKWLRQRPPIIGRDGKEIPGGREDRSHNECIQIIPIQLKEH